MTSALMLYRLRCAASFARMVEAERPMYQTVEPHDPSERPYHVPKFCPICRAAASALGSDQESV